MMMERDSAYEARFKKLLSRLKSMARELPVDYQQRVPYELLYELASSLAQGQIIEIVKTLKEVQHGTEKHLFRNRQTYLQKLSDEKQLLKARNHTAHDLQALESKHAELMKHHNMKLVEQLDSKVEEQQITLEKAGVPGFYKTSKPVEIQVQMYLLDFILRIGEQR
eukprot:TRINITY_DN5809_c0_g1_i12.p1 TRINITY_DN5809_c0_g1~~TRINITY_DN5809_c0_g1_i12.p1  ORF type:complete len:166 (-),score=20.51 TRINITY_DN5809_c0_g1_i12:312-809(-)